MNELTYGETTVVALLVGIAVLAVAIVDALLLFVWLWHKPDVDRGAREPVFARTWSLVDVWVGGQLALVMTAMLALPPMGVWLFAQGGGAVDHLPVWLLGFLLLVQNAVLSAVPIAYVRLRYRAPLADLGLTGRPSVRDMQVGIKGAALIIVCGLGLERLSIWVLGLTVSPATVSALQRLTKSFTVEGMFGSQAKSAMFLLTLAVGAGVLAPIGEELFFRGFLYTSARRRFGVAAAVVISGLAFGVVHAGPLAVVAIVPMGMLLAWYYERTGSLWVPIIMHGANNLVMVAALAMGYEGT